MADSDSAKNANLARVRDNQRRSRARRKEYLSELESKYQNCERVGVEANAEIQTAARLVLADNKRLRAMLKSLGISDADIDRSSQTPDAAKKLEVMLSQRRPCGGGAVPCGEVAGSRPASTGPYISSSSSQPHLDSPAFEALDSWSDGSRIHAMGMNQVLSHHQRQPRILEPKSPAQRPEPPQQEESSEPRSFEETLTRWSDGSRIHPTEMNQLFKYQQQQPYGTQSNPDTAETYPSTNSQSCHEIADTIRMMNPDFGVELEAELGCRGDGGECSVSNLQAFDVLDRWSDGRGAFAMGLPPG